MSVLLVLVTTMIMMKTAFEIVIFSQFTNKLLPHLVNKDLRQSYRQVDTFNHAKQWVKHPLDICQSSAGLCFDSAVVIYHLIKCLRSIAPVFFDRWIEHFIVCPSGKKKSPMKFDLNHH